MSHVKNDCEIVKKRAIFIANLERNMICALLRTSCGITERTSFAGVNGVRLLRGGTVPIPWLPFAECRYIVKT
jgi:hypothetical protein